MTMNTGSKLNETLRTRIQAEYREMPGLSLTAAQAERLWDLDHARCAQLLAELTSAGFLRHREDGRYCRNTGDDVCHWRRRVELTSPTPQSTASTFEGDACEAFVAILAAAAWADGAVLPSEIDRLEHTLSSLPVFRGRSDETLRAMIERIVHRPVGDGSLMREAAAALPADLRGTAFAVGIDVLLSDGRLRPSELEFLEDLRQHLGVRRSVARKMLGVLGTKNLVRTDPQAAA